MDMSGKKKITGLSAKNYVGMTGNGKSAITGLKYSDGKVDKSNNAGSGSEMKIKRVTTKKM